jgi:hypothetical protein
MRGRTAAPTACEAKIIFAMVIPWDKLFLEPQKMMVTGSAHSKPSHLLISPVVISATARRTPSTTSNPASAEGGTSRHRPSPTAALKAE